MGSSCEVATLQRKCSARSSGVRGVAGKMRTGSVKIYIDGYLSSDRSLLRDASGVTASAFSVFIPAGFFQ